MTETCRRSEIFRNTEFPFKALPFIPVTIQFIPGSSRLRFHFITLAVFQFPPVTVKGISIGMADKLENILLYCFVIYNFAMHSVFMIFIRWIGMFRIVPSIRAHILMDFRIIFSNQLLCGLHISLQFIVIRFWSRFRGRLRSWFGVGLFSIRFITLFFWTRTYST